MAPGGKQAPDFLERVEILAQPPAISGTGDPLAPDENAATDFAEDAERGHEVESPVRVVIGGHRRERAGVECTGRDKIDIRHTIL